MRPRINQVYKIHLKHSQLDLLDQIIDYLKKIDGQEKRKLKYFKMLYDIVSDRALEKYGNYNFYYVLILPDDIEICFMIY